MTRYLLLFSLLILRFYTQAQTVEHTAPVSFQPNQAVLFARQAPIPSVILPAINFKKVKKEDQEGPGTRFSVPIHTELNFDNSGQWTILDNGDRVWRLSIQSKGALATAFMYNDFYIPQGAQLFMYSPNHQQIKGAYTWKNNRKSRQFWTGLIKGDEAIVEYYEPKSVKGQGHFNIFRIDHVYNKENYNGDEKDDNVFEFGASFPCHENVNCTTGADWDKQKRGVVRIILVVEEGMGFCSGSLLNNTSRDGTPYLLSAYHCQDGYTPIWDMYRFDFNYESDGCDNPDVEPSFQSVLGAEYISGRQSNDFILLDLIPDIPANAHAYLNGWSRLTPNNTSLVMIHHPKGDIKKIATSNSAPIIYAFPIIWDVGPATPAYYHFKVDYDTGTFEVGSSGSPLIDANNGLVLGQLHGGDNDSLCTDNTTIGYYGHISYEWHLGNTPQLRLKEWLDPLGNDPDTLHGMEYPSTLNYYTLSGKATTPGGRAIPNANVTLNNDTYGQQQTVTDSLGNYAFTDLPASEEYQISVNIDTLYVNGVSTFDIILTSKHILGIAPFDSYFKYFAADVNNSQSISTFDIIRIRKAILGINPDFGEGGVPSWRFFRDPGNNLPAPDTAAIVFPSATILLESDSTNIDFIGVKSGDINDSATLGNL